MIQTMEVGRECTGYHKEEGLDTAKGVQGVGGAVLLQAEDQAVRYRMDGVDPTTDTGMVIAAGETIWYVGDLSKLRFLEDAAGGVLHMHTFK